MDMNGFVRRLTVLAALWALCELLLPRGRQQQMVRMAVSLMVMIALVTSLGRLLGSARPTEWPVLSVVQPAGGGDGYQRIALRSMANQAEQLCLRIAGRAGYQARAAVYLRTDASLERVELLLGRTDQPPVMDEDAVAAAIAQLLSAGPEQVCWQPPDGEALP